MGMRVIKFTTGYLFLSLALLVSLTLASTPITDDYCMAYGVKTFGFIETLSYYNLNWNPTISYYLNLVLWEFPLSTLTISFWISFLSLFLSILFVFFSIRILTAFNPPKDRLFIKVVIGILLLASFGLIQSSVYFNSGSARALEPLGILKDWIVSNFANARDGQIFLWAFSTPITAPKIYLSAAVIYFVLSLNYRNLKKHKISYFQFQLVFLFLALLVGLTTESLLLISFLVLRNLVDLKDETKKTKSGLMISFSSAGVAAIYLNSGSQNRVSSYSQEGLFYYFSLFLGNIWQFAWMLSIVAVLALLSNLFLVQRLNTSLHFHDGMRFNLRLLGIASLLSQLLIETFVYPAAYHWFSLLLVCSIWFFVEFGSVEIKFMRNNRGKNLVTFLYGMILFLLLTTFINTINTANDRKTEWDQRSNASLASGVRDLKDIPVLDNLGERFAQDLQISFPSVVPFSGVKDDFTMYCYKKLPIGF